MNIHLDTLDGEGHSSLQLSLVSLEDWSDLLIKELCDLLRRPTNEGAGIHQAVNPVVDGGEVLTLLDPLDEVIVTALALDHVPCLVTEDPDLFMALLPVAPRLHHLHDEVLGGHERKLLCDEALNHLGVDDQALGDILQGHHDGVRSKE